MKLLPDWITKGYLRLIDPVAAPLLVPMTLDGLLVTDIATAQELFNSCAAHGGKAWDHSAMVRALEMITEGSIIACALHLGGEHRCGPAHVPRRRGRRRTSTAKAAGVDRPRAVPAGTCNGRRGTRARRL